MGRRTRGSKKQFGTNFAGMVQKERKYEAHEVLAYLARAGKRAEKAAGIDTDKPKTSWLWSLDDKAGRVEAYTRSEARSLIKRKLGLKKRLPVGVKLEKIDE